MIIDRCQVITSIPPKVHHEPVQGYIVVARFGWFLLLAKATPPYRYNNELRIHENVHYMQAFRLDI